MVEYSLETPKLDVLNLTFILKEGGPLERKYCGVFSYSNSHTSNPRETFQGELGKTKTSNWS